MSTFERGVGGCVVGKHWRVYRRALLSDYILRPTPGEARHTIRMDAPYARPEAEYSRTPGHGARDAVSGIGGQTSGVRRSIRRSKLYSLSQQSPLRLMLAIMAYATSAAR